MAAPENAITVKREAECYWEKVNVKHSKVLKIKVRCWCGWKGKLGSLLCDPDDPNPPANDFWCPECKTKGWYFD